WARRSFAPYAVVGAPFLAFGPAREHVWQVVFAVLVFDKYRLRRAAQLVFREDAALYRLLQPIGLVFLQRLQVVEAADEQQVGDLLDHLQRIGDTARHCVAHRYSSCTCPARALRLPIVRREPLSTVAR